MMRLAVPKSASVDIDEASAESGLFEFGEIVVDVRAGLALPIFAYEIRPVCCCDVKPFRDVGLKFSLETREIIQAQTLVVGQKQARLPAKQQRARQIESEQQQNNERYGKNETVIQPDLSRKFPSLNT